MYVRIQRTLAHAASHGLKHSLLICINGDVNCGHTCVSLAELSAVPGTGNWNGK